MRAQLFLLVVLFGACLGKERTVSKLIQTLTNKGNYEKSSPPFEGRAAVVKVGFYFNNMDFDEKNGVFKAGGYFRQTWYDNRLRFPTDEEREMISLPVSDVNDIWLPDTFFRNAVSQEMVDPNDVLVRIYSDGRVWFAKRIQLAFTCNTFFHKFPFDTQQCPIIIESFKYTMDDIVLKFLDDRSPVEMDNSAYVKHFTTKEKVLIDCSMNYSTGAYPCLQVKIQLERDLGCYVKYQFFPSILILFFVYSSFWFGSQITLPRTLVLIAGTLFMCGLLILNGIRLPTPSVSYTMAIDLWNPICVILLMVAILEFCIVARLCMRTDGVPENSDSKCLRCGIALDWVFRVLYLIVLILFIVVYFAIYTLL